MATKDQVIFNIDEELKAKAAKFAKDRDLTLSQLIRKLLREVVQGSPQQQQDTLASAQQ